MVTVGERSIVPCSHRLARLAILAVSLPLFIAAQTIPAAAGENFDGKTITRIVFYPAHQPYPEAELLKLLPLKAGSVFREQQLPSAIQALFSTGRFANIAVDGAASPGGVTLKFLTSPAYFVGRVSVQGVKAPPNNGQLVGATKLELGREFSEPQKERAIESLQNVLRRNGFYKSSVTASTQFVPDIQQVNLNFQVESGQRARFEQPAITGAPERSSDAVIGSTKWKRLWGLLGWQQVTDSRVEQGLDNIRRYYQQKDLLLAKVTLRQLEYHAATNTVKPTIQIDTGPSVVIRTEGMRIRRGKLKQLIPVYQERAVDDDLLIEGQRNMTQYLQSEGYFDADVTFTQSTGKNNSHVITYYINRGQRHKFVRLEIAGNHYFSSETIRERMYLTPAEFPRYPHGRYSGTLLQQDIEAIKDLYSSNGFRDVKITDRLADNYAGKKTNVAVFINIDEGAQTLVSSVSIDGVSSQDLMQIRSILLSSKGQPYSGLSVIADRDNILNYFYDNGYVDATVDYSATPSSDSYRVAVGFMVRPGLQKFVRRVLVSGLKTTKPDLVRSRIDLHSGDPLSFAKDADSQRRLYDLGIFARVNTALQNPEGAEDNKYVLYQLDEASRYSVNVGIGAEFGRLGGGYTLDAPAGAAGFSPRLTLGVSRINFMGLGHTVSLQSLVSNIEQRVGLSYIAPQFIGNPDLSLILSTLYDSSHDVRTFSAIRREASAQVSQRLSRANSLQYRIVFRRVTQGDLLIDPLLVPLYSQPARVGLFGMSFIQDKRDDPADAHRGSYTTLDAGYATRILATESPFTRLSFRNSSYYPLTRELVFARSTYFGWIAPLKGGEVIPLSERFFAGGATSQRAFPENQAGPRDLETGFPLGGNAVLMNNLELRFPLIGDNIGGVLFEDAGNVYSDIHHISFRFRQDNLQDFNYMVHSVGFGIRYHTPIGPVRVDLSFSPDSPRFRGYKGSLQDFLDPNIRPTLPIVTQRINQFQFHFSLGQAF